MVGRRLALIIGNNYPNSGKELKFAVADALKMKDVLANKDICGFKNENVTLLIDKTSNEASTKLDELLTDAHKDDLILIYFSGHGKKGPNNDKLYLLFKNTNENLLNSSAISFDFINDCLKSPSALKASIIIILDCCYSGAAGIRDADLDVMEALEKPSGPGTVILTSTGSTGSFKAKEEEKLGHGVFTYYLMEGLEKGYADQDHNGYISIDELYEYAYYKTKENNSSQLPTKKGSVEGSIFIGIIPKIIKERKYKYELKKAKLIENLSPQLPSIILNESLTILKKYYTTSSPLEQVDTTILDYLESLLQNDLLPENRSDAIHNYIEVVQHLKGISINDRQKKWKEEDAEQKQEKRLERETRDKEEQERLRKQRDEELQRKREEEEKVEKEAEEKAIKEKKEQDRLRQQQKEAEKLEESKRRAQEEIDKRKKEEKKKQEEFHRQREEAGKKREEERKREALQIKKEKEEIEIKKRKEKKKIQNALFVISIIVGGFLILIVASPLDSHKNDVNTPQSVNIVDKTNLSNSYQIANTTQTSSSKDLEAIFIVSNLVIDPLEVSAGKDATISVNVGNTGNAAGNISVELLINGNMSDSKDVSLGVGNNTTVTFEHAEEVPGIYKVEIGGENATYTVEKKSSLMLYALRFIVLFIIGGAAYYFTKGGGDMSKLTERVKEVMNSVEPKK